MMGKRITMDDLPMGGCSTWQAHQAHLAAGDPRCENERDVTADEEEPDGAPVHQWEVTTPPEVYMTDDDEQEEDFR